MTAPATTIRAFERGLQILQLLNRHNGLSIDAVAAQAGLPRPTTFRLLHTLMEEGYVSYQQAERHYRLTPKVRLLSSGYQVSGWITDIAMPIMDQHAQRTPWPLALCVMKESRISVAYITDQSSQLIVQRVAPGVSIPLLSSAVGTVFLAFGAGEDIEAAHAQADGDTLDARVLNCRKDGYAVWEDEASRALAVPILFGETLQAVLAVRGVSGAAWKPEEDASYVEQLRQVAGDIITQRQAEQAFALPLNL